MKKIGNVLKTGKRKVINYLSTNRLFLSYVIFSIICTILVRNNTIGNPFDYNPLLIDCGVIIIIGALGYLIKPKNQFKYYFIWLLIYAIMCVVNSAYFHFYQSFASFSLLATAGQLGGVSDALYEELRLIDFIYLIFPLIFYFIHYLLKKTSYYILVTKVEKSKKMCVSTMLMGVIVLACSLACSFPNFFVKSVSLF